MDSLALQRLLIRHEGLKNTIYTDTVGVPTIGIGHNLHVPLSDKAVYQIFQDDVNAVVSGLNAKLPWWSGLDDVRQMVLVDMAFNLGLDGLLTFQHTLGLVKVGDYAAAADAMLDSKWATQVKGRAQRLADAMRTGVLTL